MQVPDDVFTYDNPGLVSSRHGNVLRVSMANTLIRRDQFNITPQGIIHAKGAK
jgi:hypothetical protein